MSDHRNPGHVEKLRQDYTEVCDLLQETRDRWAEARVARDRYRESLRWLVNLGYGVGKAGGEPESGEIETALNNARALLEEG